MSHLRPSQQSPLPTNRNQTLVTRPSRQIRRQPSHHPQQPGSSPALAHLPRPLTLSDLNHTIRVHFFRMVRGHRWASASPQGHAVTGSCHTQLSSLTHHRSA